MEEMRHWLVEVLAFYSKTLPPLALNLVPFLVTKVFVPTLLLSIYLQKHPSHPIPRHSSLVTLLSSLVYFIQLTARNFSSPAHQVLMAPAPHYNKILYPAAVENTGDCP